MREIMFWRLTFFFRLSDCLLWSNIIFFLSLTQLINCWISVTSHHVVYDIRMPRNRFMSPDVVLSASIFIILFPACHLFSSSVLLCLSDLLLTPVIFFPNTSVYAWKSYLASRAISEYSEFSHFAAATKSDSRVDGPNCAGYWSAERW